MATSFAAGLVVAMSYAPELFVGLLGVGTVLYGYRCIARAGRLDACAPAAERAAVWIMGAGAFAVLAASFSAVWFA